MTPQEINNVDAYHAQIVESLSGTLPDDEQKWLRAATQPL
jgi:hypothetical protein